MDYVPRILAESLKNAVKTFPAVYLSGARQCGKSTLARNLLPPDSVNYMTFDTTAVRMAARQDPDAFIAGLPADRLSIIDEVQRVPEVHLLIKKGVDEGRIGGRGRALFLLTGSADILALPRLAKAMVGRMAVLTLCPFSAAEINGSGINFVDRLWGGDLSVREYERANLAGIIKSATFPEIALNRDIDRSVWFDGYFDTVLNRDAAEFAKIRKPELLYQLLASLSGRVGNLANNDNIMKETGLNQGTFEKYMSLCSAAFLTLEIQPWARPNRLNKRFVKSKKIYFADTNFLCFLARRDISGVYERDPSFMGRIFENFVATEIMKSACARPGKFYVSHFNPVREDGKETDFIIEKTDGETIAIEVKLGETLGGKDFKNLELCRNTIGDNFKTGIVLYTGTGLVPFGDRLWAVPVNYLWE
jgi:predicted AAA+ superfamily ATPase